MGPPEPFSGRDISALYKTLPAFCRVVAEAKPTADSDIKIEVWLPVSGWNGKLQGIGNGGFAGTDRLRCNSAGVEEQDTLRLQRIRGIRARRSMRRGHWDIRRKSSTLGIAEFTR